MNSFRLHFAIMSLAVLIAVGSSVKAQPSCQAKMANPDQPRQVYAPNAVVIYNIGTVYGVQPGESTYYPAQQRVEKYYSWGLPGRRIVTDRPAYTAPGTPGRFPDINSRDPKVAITAQPGTFRYMNVTLTGERNRVLQQLLLISPNPQKDVVDFVREYPIDLQSNELKEAVEFLVQIQQLQ